MVQTIPWSELVIYALDIGVYHTNNNGKVNSNTTFAWARLEGGHKLNDLNSAAGICSPQNAGNDINVLIQKINDDVKSEKFIVIGFEAPMWFPVCGQVPSGKMFTERFNAEKTFEWYKQSGAAPTLKAISIGIILFSQLKGVSKLATLFTEKYPWKNKKEILIYEAFIAGAKYKQQKLKPKGINSDEWDAVTAAYLFYKYHYGRLNLLHKAGSWNGKVFSIVESIAQRSNLASDNFDCTVVGLD